MSASYLVAALGTKQMMDREATDIIPFTELIVNSKITVAYVQKLWEYLLHRIKTSYSKS